MLFEDKIDDIRFHKMVEASKVKRGNDVLDIGCGDKKILKYLPDVNYIGVDREGKPDILCNLEKEFPRKLERGRFDVIFMGWFLEEVENYKTILKKCLRILKSDGRIVILTPSHNRLVWRSEWQYTTHCFRPTNIENLAKQCNFKIEKKTGVFIHIPVINLVIPSNQMFYNNAFLFVLKPA